MNSNASRSLFRRLFPYLIGIGGIQIALMMSGCAVVTTTASVTGAVVSTAVDVTTTAVGVGVDVTKGAVDLATPD
ncbi:MAG: hypothetical protein B7Z82_08215 [Halothiobacillus sp. 20-54-6]|nr:MAG: hypothetical protein B7Z82_08215 [Halothiobacillus sp. 20-54-6]